jgi:phosphoserine phosphatase
MDGVVFEGSNFWLDLHLALGTDVQALALAKQYLRSDYVRMAQITVTDLWKTASAAPFERLVRERTYVPGIKALLGNMADRGVTTCIVSSGPYELASRAQSDCRVHAVFANKVETREDRFTGALEIAVDDNRKGQVLADFLARLHLENPTVAVIGDTESDAAMFDHADLRIAYDSSAEALLAKADICLARGEIPDFARDLTDYLDALAPASAPPLR